MPNQHRSHRSCRASRLWSGALTALGLLLGGCSIGSLLETPAPVEPAAEPEYQKLLAQGGAGLFPGMGGAAAVLEVSALRRSLPVQPGDWIACLRRTAGAEMAFFAVFFRSHRIETVRRAVLVDRCEGETYRPLAPK
jgi:hypothetical protein